MLKSTTLIGAASCDNWCAFLRGDPQLAAYEYLLYSDAPIVGEVAEGLGPYQFLNLAPLEITPVHAQPSVVLRAGFHIYAGRGPETEEKVQKQQRYHGGDSVDEVVAVASLLTGARLKHGAKVRRFENQGDARGRPLMESLRPVPFLSFARQARLKLPYTAQQKSLALLGEMALYPKLKPRDSIAFVRAARLYQEALWVAESDPNLSWLWLVSSIETAADQWSTVHVPSGGTDDVARQSQSGLFTYLDSLNIEGLADRVEEAFGPTLGKTKSFVGFLVEFHPDPPVVRPEEHGRIGWSKTKLHRAFSAIYNWRSRALHDGIPFPLLMCEPPMEGESGIFWEKPFGESAYWSEKDLPMLLHTFEYIARKALVRWFNNMADENALN